MTETATILTAPDDLARLQGMLAASIHNNAQLSARLAALEARHAQDRAFYRQLRAMIVNWKEHIEFEKPALILESTMNYRLANRE